MPWPSRTELPICRCDRPSFHFSRYTSRIFRIDVLTLGIRSSFLGGRDTQIERITPASSAAGTWIPIQSGHSFRSIPTTHSDHDQQVAAFDQNRRSDSVGITGRFQSESAVGFRRCRQRRRRFTADLRCHRATRWNPPHGRGRRDHIASQRWPRHTRGKAELDRHVSALRIRSVTLVAY